MLNIEVKQRLFARKVHGRRFIQTPIVIQMCKKFSAEEKDVLSAYLDYVRADWQVCCPSFKTIADTAGVSRSTVIRAQKRFIQLGILSKKTRTRASSFIFFSLDSLEAVLGVSDPSISGDGGSGAETPASVSQPLPSGAETPDSIFLIRDPILKFSSSSPEAAASSSKNAEGKTRVDSNQEEDQAREGGREGEVLANTKAIANGGGNPQLRETPLNGANSSSRLDGEQNNMGYDGEDEMGVIDDEMSQDEVEAVQHSLSKVGMARRKEKKPKGQAARKTPFKKQGSTPPKKDKEFEKVMSAFIMRCKEKCRIPVSTEAKPYMVKAGSEMVRYLGVEQAIEWVEYAIDNWNELREEEVANGRKHILETDPWIHNLTADWRYMQWKRNKEQGISQSQSPAKPRSSQLSRGEVPRGGMSQIEIPPITPVKSSTETNTENKG